MSSPRSAGLIVAVTAMTSLASGVPFGAAAAASAQTAGTTRIGVSGVARVEAAATAGDGASGAAKAAAVGPLKAVRTAAHAPVPAGKDPVSLTQLRRQAQQAYKGIEDATKMLRARQKQFDASQRQLATKLTQLQSATQQLEKMRRPLADLVSSLYQDPSLSGMNPFLSGRDGTTTLRTMSDVEYLVTGRNIVLGDAAKLLRQQEQLAAQAQGLRAANLLQEAQLNVQIDTLRKRSAKTVKTLTQALEKLGVDVNQGNRGTNACDPTRVNLATEYPNGLLPKSILCPLPQPGRELRADAAIAFDDLNLAYQRRFGKQMCVSDSYRNLGAQQSIYYRRPGFAATPGTSNHGLGLAVDLCGGVQIFRSAEFNWLEANSKKYGWMHPDWAYHSPFEPWHWEYDPKLGSLL